MESFFLQLNLLELLSLLGLVQSVYIIVHLLGRAKSFKQIIVPNVFFIFLAIAFFLNLAQRQWQEAFETINILQWIGWAIIPSLSVLFIVQILRIIKTPPIFLFTLPFLFPLMYLIAAKVFDNSDDILLAVNIGALIMGASNLLLIWLFKDDLTHLSKKKNGKERFWLIISLILMNIGLLGLYFLTSNGILNDFNVDLVRTMFGLGFIYLGATGLFRIYPHMIELKSSSKLESVSLEEDKIIKKLKYLIYGEKVYQEPGYNRSNLARELNISETLLSKLVGFEFDKTVPQILNENRVKDAKILLSDTDADITTITYESGFNSVATFNRVFKDVTDMSPTEYRKKTRTL